MPDRRAESGFTKQGPQKETEQTHSMEMLLMQKPTARTIISFQRHKHTHCYGNPINILPSPNQEKPMILNVQPSAELNADGGSEHFVWSVHLRIFLKLAKKKWQDSWPQWIYRCHHIPSTPRGLRCLSVECVCVFPIADRLQTKTLSIHKSQKGRNCHRHLHKKKPKLQPLPQISANSSKSTWVMFCFSR